MPKDKNNDLHNLNDETPELERVYSVSSDKNSSVTNTKDEESSLFEQEKSDTYFDDLDEDLLAQAEAEAEAELKLSEKRKKDKEKARKRDEKAVKDAREKYEHDIAETNEKHLRAEHERIVKESNYTINQNVKNDYISSPENYRSSQEADVQSEKSFSAPDNNSFDSFEQKSDSVSQSFDVPEHSGSFPVYDDEHYASDVNIDPASQTFGQKNPTLYNYNQNYTDTEFPNTFSEIDKQRKARLDAEVLEQQKIQQETRAHNEAYIEKLNRDALERQRDSESYKSFGHEGVDFSGKNQHSAYVQTSDGDNKTPSISENEYNTLRANYENSKNAFQASSDNVSESVMLQYKEDSERFFAVQRKIDQGELTVLPTPIYEPSAVNVDGEFRNVPFNNSPGISENDVQNTDFVYQKQHAVEGGSTVEAPLKSEEYPFDNYEHKDYIDVRQPSVIIPSTVDSNGAVINEAEYNTLRENYENSKNAFQASSDNVSESVMLQYKEDSERFFAVQRKIDQGELTVLPTPTSEPSPLESIDGSRKDTPFNTFTNEQSPLNSYNSRYPKTPRSNSFEPNNSSFGSHNTNNRDFFSPGSLRSNNINSEKTSPTSRSGLNMFEQNMARYANAVYSQTSRSATPTASSPSAVYNLAANNITRERYEALKQKHAELKKEVASYAGKDVPKEVMRNSEQTSRLFSAINTKIENGQINLVDTPFTVDKRVHEVRRGGSAGSVAKPSAFGTQAFYDRSKDNFSPRGKRVGDSHIKPLGTPFQGSPLGKYDKLKIKHALEVGSPFEMASRRSLRAFSGAAIVVAQSEQSGTAHMMVTGQDRARDAINAAKAMKDLPRQVKVAYNAVQNTATSVRNIGRFLEGKDLAAHKERKPLTVKQIKKQLNDNPFSSLEKGKIKEKFGSNSSLSNSQLKRKITFNTANNKNLKNEIKALQNKGSALSATERKKLKDLIAQKKEADAKLRNIHGAKKVREEATKRNRASDRTSKKDVIKTIKKNSKKGVRLSKKDKAVLSHLMDKKKLLEQREKLFKSRQARKQLAFSLGGVLGKAMRESEESTVQGILGASRILQNRYVRTVLKVATKTALLPVVGIKKVAGAGLRKLDNKFGVSASVKKTVKKLEEKAVRKTLNTKVYKELHGGIYNRAKKTISSKTPGKIKTGINKGKNALNQINSNRKKVLDKFNSLKSKLKDSKLGRVASKLGGGFGKIFDALNVFKKAFVKVGIYCGGFVILIALIGCFITSIGGAASSLFFGDDSADGRIDLTSYIKILNQEEQAFLTNIDTIASDPGNKYENITVNYQTGTLVNNFKEILSMTAVYFNQDFTDKTAVKTYLQQLYSDSHYFTQIESEPYSCSGCEDRNYYCYDQYDKFATNTRKSLYSSSDHYGETGVGQNSVDRYGCSYVTYYCTELGHGTYNRNGCKLHNGGKVMSSPCSCSNCEEVVKTTTETKYYCKGYYTTFHRFLKHNDGQAMDKPCSCSDYETKEISVTIHIL